MTLKNDEKFEEELTYVISKFTWGTWQILTRALKSQKFSF